MRSHQTYWGFLTLLAALAVFFMLGNSPAPAATIVSSKHNLSASGPGPVRAASEDRICVFCHTPHGGRGDAPLWNRNDSTAAYIPYDSPTLQASPGQPTGASKLCLSCHDGTIAMGDLISEPQAIAMSGSQTMPPGGGLIGTDLRDDHPISFSYFDSIGGTGGSRYASPGSWDPRVQLDSGGQLQCTTCHDAHDDQWGRFLVMDNQASALCQQCHVLPLFPSTPHATSPRTWNGSGRDPWPHTEYADVRTNACSNCHYSHHAGGNQWLLSDAREEEVCFVCHSGNVAQKNVASDFSKSYAHPVERYQGLHEDGERPEDAADHVECADCHNPHQAAHAPAMAPNVPGVMRGVSGVDASGSPVDEAMFEYEVCFKCHGPYGSSPLNVIPRQIVSTDVIKEFSLSSPSYHPVQGPGRSGNVPSLIGGLSPSSIIYCGDCHGSDSGGGGGSAKGPHGSNYEYMLVRQYTTGDNVSESPTTYALCYGCHSRSSILGDQSFDYHERHIVEERTSCSVCHDAHGIDYGQGNSVNNARLMNFDVSVVEPDPVTGRLEYRSTGMGSGECFLRCHNVDHSPRNY